MTVIVPSVSTIQPQAYSTAQLNSSRSLAGPSNTVPIKEQPAVVVSISNGSNASAIAAGASDGGVAAAALSDLNIYNKLSAEAASLNWDGLAKVEGSEKAQEAKAAYEANIQRIGGIVATEAAAAGVSFSVASSQNESSGSQPYATQNEAAKVNHLSSDKTSYQQAPQLQLPAIQGLKIEGGASAALQILQSASGRVSKTV